MLEDKFMGASIWLWIVGAIVIYLLMKQQNEEMENFANENKIKIYNFNTEWCGWSKKFQPEWDAFSKAVSSNPNVEARDVKCDRPENEAMCKSYNVPGFPSVVIEKNGERVNYSGPRTKEGLMKMI